MRYGTNAAKSEFWRASTHASWPSEAARAMSAGELGRDPARLLVVAARDPDQARVIAVRRGAVQLGRRRVEQLPGLVGDEHLVTDPLDRRQRLGA